MFKKILNNWQIGFLILVISFFFYPFIFQGKIPIPADTIVGLYHPFRDVTWDNLISGVPFKNFLITDPVRQQYPWRELAISMIKSSHIPLWNQYSFGGTPLLANLQAAVFNPLNILFFILPFAIAWGLQVYLQLLLAGIFMYVWLRNLKLEKNACLLGSLAFCFSGFFVAWLEWNTVIQTAMWLPLILLAKDKLILLLKTHVNSFSTLMQKDIYKWSFVLVFAQSSAFFSGHLQIFFYIIIVSTCYLLLKGLSVIKDEKNRLNFWLLFSITGCLSILITAIQSLPFIELIFNSARSFDQPIGFRTDWYLPWQHLIQLLVPDFFGNPATLNYFGQWNYGEFVSYIGIIPLLFAVIAIFGRRDKKTLFFSILGILSLVFALPNFISFLPYQFQLAFISTTAPSRLIFVTDFSLAVLAAMGLDLMLKEKKTKVIFWSGIFTGVLLGIIWMVVLVNPFKIEIANLLVAKRNLYLPALLFVVGWLLILCHTELVFVSNRSRNKFGMTLMIILLLLTSFDLLRFSQKFNPFVKKEWIFPSAKVLVFLQKQEKPLRIFSLDSHILPPNFSLPYRLETVEGYDPIYDLGYGEFWAAVKRNRPDISSFNFNRIITPQLVDNNFVNLLGVKYFLSLNEINNKNINLIYGEGQTKVYENKNAFPRAVLVNKIVQTNSKQEAIGAMFQYQKNLDEVAIVSENPNFRNETKNFQKDVQIISYEPQKIVISTKSNAKALLVLANTFYPGWQVKVDKVKVPLLKVDYILQGVVVAAGEHEVTFYYLPKSFLFGLATTLLGLSFIFLWGVSVWLKK